MIQRTLYERGNKMNSIFAKLRLRGNVNKYRKILSTNEEVFPSFANMVVTTIPYVPGALSEPDEWFLLSDVSHANYTLDLLSTDFNTLDFDSLARAEFSKIDFLFVVQGDILLFQNVTRAKLASRKHIWDFGEGYQFQSECNEIVVNSQPDAIYCRDNDTLYFRRLESITSIFKGIDQIYKEATDEETAQFLQSSFIKLGEAYAAENVKTANRKKIALAAKTISNLEPQDRDNIFTYIGDYCPSLKTPDNKFAVSNDDELKLLLYGIEQRFYTTLVGNERRIANSVIPLV